MKVSDLPLVGQERERWAEDRELLVHSPALAGIEVLHHPRS